MWNLKVPCKHFQLRGRGRKIFPDCLRLFPCITTRIPTTSKLVWFAPCKMAPRKKSEKAIPPRPDNEPQRTEDHIAKKGQKASTACSACQKRKTRVRVSYISVVENYPIDANIDKSVLGAYPARLVLNRRQSVKSIPIMMAAARSASSARFNH